MLLWYLVLPKLIHLKSLTGSTAGLRSAPLVITDAARLSIDAN